MRRRPLGALFGFDLDDVRTIIRLAAAAGVVIGGAATAGAAVRVFLLMSGLGGG